MSGSGRRTGSRDPAQRGPPPLPKVGYCFFDQARLAEQPPEHPRPRHSGRTTATARSDSSSRWASPRVRRPLPVDAPDQRLLVSGLEDGVYRLWADADPDGWFRETNEDNNLTWVDLRLTLTETPPRVEVVRRGPAGASAWVTGWADSGSPRRSPQAAALSPTWVAAQIARNPASTASAASAGPDPTPRARAAPISVPCRRPCLRRVVTRKGVRYLARVTEFVSTLNRVSDGV